LLAVIQTDILPLTRAKVATGSKMFGAAILDHHLRLVHADTNDETTCALFHGEVKCIYAWSRTVATASDRREIARTAIFLSTHEPCCMCISSILWCGFHTVYYLFSYETTAAQGIPYDIETMHELWGVNTYRKQNKYLTSVCLLDCIAALDDDDDIAKTELQQMAAALMAEYDQVSQAQDVTSAVS
jgi:tRNA(Arg) A34 adenosine deaminase TadA